jgi:UDP:flavonoid glycosyltransferase YjiC (YdhE family)
MEKPAVIMITSNGVGAGHLIRASAIARALQSDARPIIFSMAYSVVEVAKALDLDCEYIPGRDKGLMPRKNWDSYLRDRLIALIDEIFGICSFFSSFVRYIWLTMSLSLTLLFGTQKQISGMRLNLYK